MGIKTRASVLSIREEVTEGTPLLASASGDFVALQDGFEFVPEVETLENAELRNSIGQAKPNLGLERATGNLSHYVRHSGVEGQAPDWDLLLKACLGGKDVESTEYDTVSSSTTTVLNVNTGEGAQFRKGQGLLIKDPVNGRSIRNVMSTPTGDALSLNFKLSSAPAAGVNLGKCVGYYPQNEVSSLTCDLFRGNDGTREVTTGVKVEEMSISIEAGQYINGSFSLRGTRYYFDAIEIGAAKYLDFNDGSTDYSISVESKVYRDPHELAEAIQTAMNDTASADTYTVTYNDYGANAGKFTIATDGSTLTLKWQSGTNTANTIGTKLGFIVSSDDTSATSYTSDNAQSWAAAYTPSYDEKDPDVAKAAEAFLGSQDNNYNVCIRTATLTVSNEIQEEPCISSVSGIDSTEISGRTVEVELVATLDKHSAREFKYYRTGESIQFMLNAGEKVGGSWQAGKSINLYLPTATVSSFSAQDDNGTVVLNITLRAFVNAQSEGEFFLNLL